jgi:hypothetical protein
VQLDELSLDANCGALECSLMMGSIDESANAVMFLEEMFHSQASLGEPPGGKKGPFFVWIYGREGKGKSRLKRTTFGPFLLNSPPPHTHSHSQASMSLGKRPPHHLGAPGPDVEPPALTYLKGLQAWKLDDTTQGLALMERAIAGQYELSAQLQPSLDT